MAIARHWCREGLAEDTTGKGHLSKAVNERIRNCIFVALE